MTNRELAQMSPIELLRLLQRQVNMAVDMAESGMLKKDPSIPDLTKAGILGDIGDFHIQARFIEGVDV